MDNLCYFIDIDFSFEFLGDYNRPYEKVIKLMQVLKELVKEKVPLRQKEAILEVFESNIQQEVSHIVQQIRLKLIDDLPENTTLSINAIGLPPDLEEMIRHGIVEREGKKFLAITPENCQDLLMELRTLLNQDKNHNALVVEDESIRFHLKKLIELEFPQLIVSSMAEFKF